MKNSYSHFYLYAKGHYKRTNVVDDMKKIISHRSYIDIEYIQKEDIVSVLTDVVYRHIENEYQFSKFLSEVVIGRFWLEINDPFEKFIDACLRVLNIEAVLDEKGNTILELDEPDYSILSPNDYLKKEED